MITYLTRRVLQAVLILAGLSVLFFALLHAQPGGACAYILATPSPNSQTRFNACIVSRGLDQPLPVQYLKWVGATLHLDLGQDYTGQAVIDTIKLRLPATIILIGLAYIVQQIIAIPLGMLGALKRYSFYDQVLTFLSYIGLSLPTFWLGLMLILFFSVNLPKLGWWPHVLAFPPGGIVSGDTLIPPFGTSDYWHYFAAHPGQTIGDLASHLVLPATTLAIIGIATDSRFMRAAMLDVIGLDYVRTARAKGLPPARVILKHALRNALLPIITNVGLFIPTLISGAIITETIFAWPGMGKYFIDAASQKDTNALQAVLLLTALFTLVGNLVADLLYAAADPRIRYD